MSKRYTQKEKEYMAEMAIEIVVKLNGDSSAAVPEAVEVSPELKAELELRMIEFEENPESGYSWDQVKSRLKDGSWRTA